MDNIENPYQIILERLHVLDRSIYIINHVNNDLRQILHKQKPLPKFIVDSFKRSVINKSKSSPALPPSLPPTETEEMRLAASVIDKAKRTIENVGEKKLKPSTTVIPPVPAPVQSNSTQNNRPKTASSVRPSSASSTNVQSSNSTSSQTQPPVRRYVPAHMKAPFLTQPEKKRRPNSSIRNSTQINSTQRTSTTRRSTSQQRRPSSSSSTQSILAFLQPTTQPSADPTVQNEQTPITDNQNLNGINDYQTNVPDSTPVVTTTEEQVHVSNEVAETDTSSVPQPIILNRALIKPLRRLWKHNQSLRLRLERELEKKSTTSPVFIDRVNEQLYTPINTDAIHVPNIEVLLQLAIKLRSIVLYLLENSTFDDLDSALKRLNTLKYLINQYHYFFTSNIPIFVATHHSRLLNININIDEWLKKSKSSKSNPNIVRYSDDSQLIAFTEVRFKQFENECRWIELTWHEQMISKFQKTISNKNQNSLQIYRELMSLVTGLQTSTPIVVENRYE